MFVILQKLVRVGVNMNNRIIKMTANWCPPCKVMDKTVIQPLEARPNNNFDIVKVDIDLDENKELVEEFAVRSIPTTIFLVDGEEVERVIGAVPLSQIDEIITKVFN